MTANRVAACLVVVLSLAGAAALAVQPPAAGSGLLEVTARAGESDAAHQRRINTVASELKADALIAQLYKAQGNERLRASGLFKGTNLSVPAAIALLNQNLHARVIEGTSLVELTMTNAGSIEERAFIVNAWGEAMVEQARERVQEQGLGRVTALNNIRLKCESRLKDVEAELREKLAQGGDGGGVNVKEIELGKLVAERTEAGMLLQHKRNVFQAAKEAMENGKPLPGEAERLMQVATDLRPERERLLSAQRELGDLQNDFGPKAKEVERLQQRVEKLRTVYQRELDEARKKARAAIMEEMAQDLQIAEMRIEWLHKATESLRADVAGQAQATQAIQSLRHEQQTLRDHVRRVKEQVDEALAQQSTPPRGAEVEWRSRAVPVAP